MNFKENETPRKLRGGYYTEPAIVDFLLRWVLAGEPTSLLEPSCGDGAFFRGLQRVGVSSLSTIEGFEIEKAEAEKSRAAISTLEVKSTRIRDRDFLAWALKELLGPPQFDAVVGNPPFIRYQYLDTKLQDISREIFGAFSLKFTKHTNAWVPFLISSIALLRPGGRLGMVLPAELLHILHAESARKFAASRCSRILIIDPEELWFGETLQGAIIMLAEKAAPSSRDRQGIAILPVNGRRFLSDEPNAIFSHADYSNGRSAGGKWMRALLTWKERDLIDSLAGSKTAPLFGEIAEVAVGIVTGANKFFLIDDSTKDEYALHKWTFPIFGRSAHVPGVVYDETTHARNQRLGYPTNLVWIREDQKDELTASAQRYIEFGEEQNLHMRYKCRVRSPWFSVPSVYATEVAMLKRSHDFPRLVHNKLKAFTTDTAYRVVPKKVSATTLVHSFVNSLTALSAELEGRHYGGGVLELVPSEIRRLAVPIVESVANQVDDLDSAFKRGLRSQELLARQNKIILRSIGLSKNEIATLEEAWTRLRDRRQRRAARTSVPTKPQQ